MNETYDDINDSVGGLVGEDIPDGNGGTLSDYTLGTTYSEAYTGAGNAMETQLSGYGFDVDVQTGGEFDFNSDFAISFWYYNDLTGDGDVRGMRVYDTLSGTTSGIQLGSNATGLFNARFDDDSDPIDPGNFVITNGQTDMPGVTENVWSHVVMNYDYGTEVKIYFDGTLVDTDDVSALTGTLTATQRLQIGMINGGGTFGASQQGALDDLAWYDGLLDATQIADLAAGTTSPADYAGAVLLGDTDGDGDIDDSDLGTSFANYTGPVGAAGGKTAAQGDTDGDGDVDDSDLGTSFAGYTGPLGPASVPEPTSIALLGLGVVVAARRRRG